MKTKEQVKEQYRRLFKMAYDYYGNNPRRRKFIRLINLLSTRRTHPYVFKHKETTWQSCWDYAFKEG